MLKRVFKASLALSLAASMLVACTNNLPNVEVDPVKVDGSQTSGTISTALEDLKFTKVDESKVAEYNALLTKNSASNTAQGGAVAPTSAAAPLGSAEAISSRGVAADAKMAAYPMMYFPTPGPFEEYTVVDFEESKLNGYSGTYLKTMSDIVKPLVAKLASDSRMVNSSGSTDIDGKTIANPSTPNQTGAEIYPVYNQYQWSFSFVSTSKKEVYSINVSSTETLVLKQKWGLRDLKIDTIKIDSSDAVKILSDAIKNKKEVENEQKQYLDQNATVLYEIPKNASWYFYLEQEKGSLVWNVNMNIYDPQPIQDCAKPMPMPLAADTVTSSDGSVSSAGSTSAVAPCAYVPPAYYYSGAYARVDAITGKIIYFSRPIKWKNTYTPPVYDGPVTIQPAPAVVEGSSGGSDAAK